MKGRASLIAVERGGRRWEAAIGDNDVARVQAILDVVDARLANPGPRPAIWPHVAKAVPALSAVLGLMVGQLAMAVAAVISLIQPSSPMLAGAGAAALAAAGLSLRTPNFVTGEIHTTGALLLALVGIALLIGARASKDDDIPARAKLALVALLSLTALSIAPLLMNGVDPVTLYQSALAFPSAAVFLFALAGTLARWPSRPARRAAIPAAALGLLGIATGSTLFLDKFGRDVFLGDAAPVTWTTIDAEPSQESALPVYATGVRVSPGGRSVLVTSGGGVERYETSFLLGRAGRPLARIRASEVVFVDDDRVLAVNIHDEDADVREVHVDAPDHTIWEQRVTGIVTPVLSYRAASRTWQLLGVDTNRGIVRASAVLGDSQVDTMRWAPPPDPTRWPQVIATSGSHALMVETRYPSIGNTSLWVLWSLMQGLRMESRLTRVDPAGHTELARTRFTAQCLAAIVPDERLICSVFDGTRTRFAAIDPATSNVTSMAWLPGMFAGAAISDDGWMSGWLGSEPVAVRPSTREGLRLSRSRYHPGQVVAHGSTMATLSYAESGSTLRLYRLAPDHLRASGR